MLPRALLLMLLLTSTSALATFEGTLWDPAFQGEGWTVESQNDVAFLTWYMYEDGRPAFRTVVANITYAADGSHRYNGTVFRTENRTSTVSVGAFTGELRVVNNTVRGTFNAAGSIRQIRTFDFNFSEPLDRYHGTWVFAQFVDPTEGAAVLVRFDSTISQDQFGRFRGFRTSEGFMGFVDILTDGRVRAFTDFRNGTGVLFVGVGGDDSAIGQGSAVNSTTFAAIGPQQLGLAKSIANTEGEQAALGNIVPAVEAKTGELAALRKRFFEAGLLAE